MASAGGSARRCVMEIGARCFHLQPKKTESLEIAFTAFAKPRMIRAVERAARESDDKPNPPPRWQKQNEGDSWMDRSADESRPSATALAEGASPSYELCFRSVTEPGRAVSFPCDAAGRVDLDALTEQARRDYLFARTVVGHLFDRPAVRAN